MNSETIQVLQALTHYSLHLLFPGIIARIFFPKNWRKAWLIMVATLLVDLDHLVANPVYNPDRCSIGFHPLHSYWAIGVYFFMLFIPAVRIAAVGLLFHMLTDFQDCLWIKYLEGYHL